MHVGLTRQGWVARLVPFALLVSAFVALAQGMSGATPVVQIAATRPAPTDVEVLLAKQMG